MHKLTTITLKDGRVGTITRVGRGRFLANLTDPATGAKAYLGILPSMTAAATQIRAMEHDSTACLRASHSQGGLK